MPYFPHNAVGVTPANQTAIASATYQMNGLGAVAAPNTFAITPSTTGRVLVLITGDLVENATGQTATCQISYGTGAAPANAAAVTGTQTGPQPTWVSLTGNLTVYFCISTVITGLTIGTVYWLDLAMKSSAGNVQLTNATCVAIEI